MKVVTSKHIIVNERVLQWKSQTANNLMRWQLNPRNPNHSSCLDICKRKSN